MTHCPVSAVSRLLHPHLWFASLAVLTNMSEELETQFCFLWITSHPWLWKMQHLFEWDKSFPRPHLLSAGSTWPAGGRVETFCWLWIYSQWNHQNSPVTSKLPRDLGYSHLNLCSALSFKLTFVLHVNWGLYGWLHCSSRVRDSSPVKWRCLVLLRQALLPRLSFLLRCSLVMLIFVTEHSLPLQVSLSNIPALFPSLSI